LYLISWFYCDVAMMLLRCQSISCGISTF